MHRLMRGEYNSLNVKPIVSGAYKTKIERNMKLDMVQRVSIGGKKISKDSSPDGTRNNYQRTKRPLIFLFLAYHSIRFSDFSS